LKAGIATPGLLLFLGAADRYRVGFGSANFSASTRPPAPRGRATGLTPSSRLARRFPRLQAGVDIQGKAGLLAALLAALIALWTALVEQWARLRQHFAPDLSRPRDIGGSPGGPKGISPVATIGAFTTAC
jgi:hypothetical protein